MFLLIGDRLMPKEKRKPVVKFAALEKSIESSIGALKDVYDSGAAALEVRAKEKRHLLTESKRLTKKKTILLKKKRAAAAKLQKSPDAETRKTLKVVEKELAVVSKTLVKTNAEKTTIAQELAGLKVHLKRATEYLKGVSLADKALNKPQKRKKLQSNTVVSELAA